MWRATVNGSVTKGREVPPALPASMHPSTLIMMKTPSVCQLNDTARFHAVLQNTAQD